MRIGTAITPPAATARRRNLRRLKWDELADAACALGAGWIEREWGSGLRSDMTRA
jgi:hypothetical protein